MAQLTAAELVKRYRGRAVVDGVSLSLGAGEIVGLLGPNGAGKTTCFYMIAGLVPADGGRVEIDGRDVTLEPMHVRHQSRARKPRHKMRQRRHEGMAAIDNVGSPNQRERYCPAGIG